MSNSIFATLCFGALGCLCMLVGCSEHPIVLHESVPVTRDSEKIAANTGEPKYQMIAAIADREDATWFFKMTGPIDQVTQVQDGWSEFLQSIKYPAAEPSWSVPEGWSSEGFKDKQIAPGMVMRMAEVATSQSEVKVSISSMPAGQELLPNVNRWRGQLGLEPTTAIELATQMGSEKSDAATFKIFDAKGPVLTTRMGGGRPPFAGGGGMSRAPFAGKGKIAPNSSGHVPAGHPPMNQKLKESKPDSAPFAFAQPNGWNAGETSAMFLGRWSRKGENGSLEMKLMTMNPTDEAWKLNVEAWSRQVKQESLPNVDAITTPIEVAGQPGRMASLKGPVEDSKTNQQVHAVMFQNPAGNGFVLLLSGAQEDVQGATGDFRTLLDTVSFDNIESKNDDDARKQNK